VSEDAVDDDDDDDDDDGGEEEMSWLEDGCIVFFTEPDATSFLGICFIDPCDGALTGGIVDAIESMDGLDTISSLNLESWDARGVAALSTDRSRFVDAVLVAGVLSTDRTSSVSLSELVRSDREILRGVPARLFLGTSCSLNFSVDCTLLLAFGVVGFASWIFASSLSIDGDSLAEPVLLVVAMDFLVLSFSLSACSDDGCLPFSWKAMWGVEAWEFASDVAFSPVIPRPDFFDNAK
jgi:hypothetical protein